ncbi:transcription elongation factor GreA [Candidatus Berkelbacteria bacterium]|nr:transcription elongation factor GreA [Candidatus Berkelbacteria bacterium]
MPTSHQVTPEGLAKLEAELAKLKTKDRPDTVKRLAAARELGDLSENADYADAREQLAFIEGRIEELQVEIKQAEVVTKRGAAGMIQIGSVVTVLSKGQIGTLTYTIVGSNESDPVAGKISAESPVGSALLGMLEGGTVKVKTPAGLQEFLIKKVA